MNTPAKTSVLLVDDNPAVLTLLKALFEEEGLSAELAKSAQAAREALVRCNGEFDLVLSDISMPKETGFDLLKWIKQDSRFAHLPVLLTTAELPQAENRIKGLSLGAVDYVVRPIELKELVIRAKKAIFNYRRQQQLESTLADSAHLALVGRLLAASNHDIKNLAMLVRTSADLVAKLVESRLGTLAPQEKKLLDTLRESSDLLTDVSRNTYALLSTDQISLTPVNAAGLVRSIAELLAARVKPCRLVIDDFPQTIAANGHPTAIKQILINLLLNAKDAIQELNSEVGGTISIKIETTDNSVKVHVQDTGIGLANAKTIDEFQAFNTTKKLRGGQGLGLWLSSRYAIQMGGRLYLTSEGIGKGTTATLELMPATAMLTEDIDITSYLIDEGNK